MTEAEEVRTAYAKASYVRVTPMKARRLVDVIRGMQAEEALAVLKFAPQSASEPVYKVVASAVMRHLRDDAPTDRRPASATPARPRDTNMCEPG